MDVRQIKRLCNDRSFARGEAYFNEGHVQSLAEQDGVLTAVVSGQQDYRVKLRWDDSEVEYSCNCPVGLDGKFCKHLVAAGLAWINPDEKPSRKTGGRKTRTPDKIQDFLKLQDRSTLIQMLTDEAAENRSLRERL